MQTGSPTNYFPHGKSTPVLADARSYGPIYTTEQKTVAALFAFFTSGEFFDYHRPNAPDRETIVDIRNKLSHTAFKAAAHNARPLIAELYAGIPQEQHCDRLAEGLILAGIGDLDLGPAGNGWKKLGVPYPYFLGNAKLILSARLRKPFMHSGSHGAMRIVHQHVSREFKAHFSR